MTLEQRELCLLAHVFASDSECEEKAEFEILLNQSGTASAVPPVRRETPDAAMLIGAPGVVAVSFMVRS